jgi:ElaB/YqjD/DUF883 family membrane-anchored ribosome-binding protein
MTDGTQMREQVGELREDFSKLRSDLGHIVQTMVEAGKAQAGETRERLEARAKEQLDALAHGLSSTRDCGRAAAKKVYGQIEEHPLTSVLSALGVGFVLGLLIGRK